MAAKMFAKLLLLVCALTSALASDGDRCYDSRLDFYPYLSTKTAYHHVHGTVSRASNCTPVQIWALIRHGTRYPGKDLIPNFLTKLPQLRDEIVKNHEIRDGHLCAADLLRLSKWEPDPNMKVDNDEFLTEQGEQDLFQMATRLKGAFPELLQVEPQNVKPDDYLFRATNTQRTQESMKSFLRGIFGLSKAVTPVSPPEKDTLLMAHKSCPAWGGGNSGQERDKFTEGPEVQGLIANVSQRLGFMHNLEFDTIKIMYDMCRFEAAWYVNKTSTWCTVFSKEELKILEYREDLSYYYFSGPLRKLSRQLGSNTLGDMIEHFKNLESGNYTNQPKGVFYFAHTVTLQNLMAALKLNIETRPPLASNYKYADQRKYRTSLYGPFATNVVAVFYRCTGATSPNKVSIHVAEKLINLPGCKDGLCNWGFFKRQYESSIETRRTDFCSKKEGDTADPSAAKQSSSVVTGGAADSLSKSSCLPIFALSCIFHRFRFYHQT